MHNNNKELTLSAPLSGPVLTLAKVPDAVFASGAMGDGIAIDPLNDTLHAPCAGVVVHVARTGHVVTLRADNGAELLLHLGLDTVELQGQGFSMLVQEGARVANGQPLLRYDLDKVAQQCKSLVSLLILAADMRQRGARVLLAAPDDIAERDLTLTRAEHPALDPILAIQSFYVMAAGLAVARGMDPDQPRHLSKVTRTH